MFSSLWSIGLAACLAAGEANPPVGCLVRQPGRSAVVVGARSVPYRPREGDLIFYDDHNRTWLALFAMVGTGPPTHMGIVVRKPDGSLAVLEAGPDDGLWVELLDLKARLRQFHRDFRGTITIRRCKQELSRAQSAALTKFALAQKGKRYAAGRLLLQGTPLRARGLLAPLLATTYLERDSWICSELAVAAGNVAGLLRRDGVRGNATYPRDLVDNRLHDLHAVWQDPATWRPNPRGGAASRLKTRVPKLFPRRAPRRGSLLGERLARPGY